MKFHTILTLSATVLCFHQVFALTPQASVEDVSITGTDSLAASDPVLLDTNVPGTLSEDMANDAEVQDGSIEADLIKNLGWSKKDSAILTSFLTAVDQIGTIIGDKAQNSLDQATVDMLSEFQIHARQLMADAGFEFRQDEDNRRVLTYVNPHEQAFPEMVERMVLGLVDLLNKLKEASKKSPFMAVILNLVTNLLKSLGAYLERQLLKSRGHIAL